MLRNTTVLPVLVSNVLVCRSTAPPALNTSTCLFASYFTARTMLRKLFKFLISTRSPNFPSFASSLVQTLTLTSHRNEPSSMFASLTFKYLNILCIASTIALASSPLRISGALTISTNA